MYDSDAFNIKLDAKYVKYILNDNNNNKYSSVVLFFFFFLFEKLYFK